MQFAPGNMYFMQFTPMICLFPKQPFIVIFERAIISIDRLYMTTGDKYPPLDTAWEETWEMEEKE